MLELRGGLASIESISSIRLSLFWIEHNISAARDTVPRFLPPFHLLKNQYSALSESRGLVHREKAVQTGGVTDLLSDEMMDILTELSVLTMALSADSAQRVSWDDPNFPGFAFYPTLYKLLAIQTISNENNFRDAVQEMCRLGGILFLAEVRRKFGISPIVTHVQTTKLRRLLDTNHMLRGEELDCIRIWAIVMACCAEPTEANRAWAVRALIRSSVFSRYQSWDNLINMISNLWWIEEVFFSKSRELRVDVEEAFMNI
jgi:hypothetical protein